MVQRQDENEEAQRQAAVELHRELIRRLGVETERQGLTEESLLAELKETRRAVYAETYGRAG